MCLLILNAEKPLFILHNYRCNPAKSVVEAAHMRVEPVFVTQGFMVNGVNVTRRLMTYPCVTHQTGIILDT